MPLTGLALGDLEAQEGRAPIGERAAVPWTQRGFWTRACHAAAHDTTNTLAAFLPDVLPARRRTNLLEALSLTLRNNRAYPTLSHPSARRWRWGNDHLPGGLQEDVVRPVEDLLMVLYAYLVHGRWDGTGLQGV